MLFTQKLKDIITNNSVDYIMKEYGMDHFLLRHFLQNQKDDSMFIEIRDKLANPIIINKDNESLKFKLLSYFEDCCVHDYSDEIVDILYQMLQNTQNIVLQRRIGIFIEKLEPKGNINVLSEILCKLINSNDQIVREFTTKSAIKFIDQYTEEQIDSLLKTMFFTNWSDDDVVQTDVSISLKFRWQDLKDASFRESANFLGEVIQTPKYILNFLDLTMKVYNDILSSKSDTRDINSWNIKYTYSWRLPKQFPVTEREFEYESQKDKRIALEIWNALIKIDAQNPEIASQACEILVQKWEYLIYFEILARFLIDKWPIYQSIIKKMLYNKDLLRLTDINEKKWVSLFNNYLTQCPDEINDFERFIINYSIEDKKVESRIKAELTLFIPEWKKGADVQHIREEYEEKVRKDYKIKDYTIQEREDDDEVNFATVRTTFDSALLMTRKENTELKEIIEQYVLAESTFDKDVWDLNWPFEEYISRNPDQLASLYSDIKHLDFKGHWQWLLWWLARWYVAHYKDAEMDIFYNQILNLYAIFSDTKNINESPARLEIARSLDDGKNALRSEDTWKLKGSNPELFEKIKKLVIDLATDPDPSNPEYPEHAGLNTVRGLWTMLVCVLLFYYPKTEDDLTTTVRILSNDDNPWIQAQLVDNLIYLIPDNKDYDLCKEMISKFKTTEIPIIQLALVRYMFRLWNKKIEENKDLIQILCNSADHNVRSSIWDLIWQALLNDASIEDIFDKILEMKEEDEDILEAITMEFQNKMSSILVEQEISRRDKYLWYFERIIDFKSSNKENINAVRSRLWYFFGDVQKLPMSFDILDTKWILDKLIAIPSQDTQKNINGFFLKFIRQDKYIERILDLLWKQIDLKLPNWYSVMLIDSWLSKEIVEILKYLYDKNSKTPLPETIFLKMEKLFDEGLKYGEKWFYEIFNEYYKDIT